MIRVTSWLLRTVIGIPRESGDDPDKCQAILTTTEYSPRERG